MGVALWTAQRATCLRRRVGAVLLDAKGFVLATGYNGVAAGLPHCNEVTEHVVNPALRKEDGTYRVAEHWERDTVPVYGHACQGAQLPSGQGHDLCGAIHAEQNALLQCRDTQAIHTVYCTTAPCVTCTKLLMNTSAARIVYLEGHVQSEASRALWMTLGRAWEAYSGPPLTNYLKVLLQA